MLLDELQICAAQRGGELQLIHTDSLGARGKDRGNPAVPGVRTESFQLLQTKLRLARRPRVLQRESLELRKAATARLPIERLWSTAADSRSPSPAWPRSRQPHRRSRRECHRSSSRPRGPAGPRPTRSRSAGRRESLPATCLLPTSSSVCPPARQSSHRRAGPSSGGTRTILPNCRSARVSTTRSPDGQSPPPIHGSGSPRIASAPPGASSPIAASMWRLRLRPTAAVIAARAD